MYLGLKLVVKKWHLNKYILFKTFGLNTQEFTVINQK